MAVTADISVRSQAEASVQTVVDRFGRLDILVNNAGVMLLGPIVGADVEDWERMLAINVQGLLYVTRAALPHLLSAAADSARGVADVVNISSIAGRQAWKDFGVYNLTKFGVNGFTESLRQEVTRQHVRVGVLEPGAVDTELESHNSDRVKTEVFQPFNERTQKLEAQDIADGIAFMVTRPTHASIAELWMMPTEQPERRFTGATRNPGRSESAEPFPAEVVGGDRVECHVEFHRARKIGKSRRTDENAGYSWKTLNRSGCARCAANRYEHWGSRNRDQGLPPSPPSTPPPSRFKAPI